MKKYFLIVIVFAILVSSCKVVGTLHPLSENEKDFLFKKELISRWGNTKDNQDSFNIDTVAGTGGKLYQAEMIDHVDENRIDTSWFLMRLIRVSDWYFLDCWMDLKSVFAGKEKDYNDLLVTKHFLCHISFIGSDKIELVFPDPDELIKLIDTKKLLLTYSPLREDDYLILNQSGDLQKQLTESKKYPSLYKDKALLTRLK